MMNKPIEGEFIEKEKQPVENKEMAVVPQNSVLPSFPTKNQIDEYEKFLTNFNGFIDKQLKDKIDFGVIPGVDRPSLFKPGAEKLEKLYFYRHEKILVEKIVNPDYIKYTYRTVVYNNASQVVATCEGTCNSHEKKYRYRWVSEKQATEEEKADGQRFKKTGKYGDYFSYRIENTEVADLENTIMKMAQKRSYVGAILEATNSSGRFTQDVEDMNIATVKPKAGQPKQTQQPQDEMPTVEYDEYGAPLDEPFPSNANVGNAPKTAPVKKPVSSTLRCSDCGQPINAAEKKFSESRYGMVLGRCCQGKYKPKK